MKGSTSCKIPKKEKEKKEKSRALEDDDTQESTDSEDLNKVDDNEDVCALKIKKSRAAKIIVKVKDDNIVVKPQEIMFLVDSGVHKTLLSEDDWMKIKMEQRLKLKKNRTKFTPFGTNINLIIMGRTKCELETENGQKTKTIIYVVKDQKQSLLGLKDGEDLEIIKINCQGGLDTEEV